MERGVLLLIAFFVLSISICYLLFSWIEKDKAKEYILLSSLNKIDIFALISLISSIGYLVQFPWVSSSDEIKSADLKPAHEESIPELLQAPLADHTDQEIALAVRSGQVASHTLESLLGDSERAVRVRRMAVGEKLLTGLPFEGMDYTSVIGQCCERVIGFVQVPVGVAGPLLLDGEKYMVPMATTEGCLVASTNRGCKAITVSGGAQTEVLKDEITRAPVVKLPNITEACRLKRFLEDSRNFDTLANVFRGAVDVPEYNVRRSRFANLRRISCCLAGRHAYIRFSCSTGDAMGMNMISAAVENVLSYLKPLFPDMRVISISGNYCADKKATAVNWIEGRGKSVVCEAVIKEEVVESILKTSVRTLIELNTTKNLAGSALAGAMGGFNAHAANVVSAIYIATGQDPAQNVESSHCMTLLELDDNGRDLRASVTMPCIEVGTVGGGTQLPSQAACLNLLGVKGPNMEFPGRNAQTLARIVSGAVLAGELSLLAALASNHLVNSHMRYNRSRQNLANH